MVKKYKWNISKQHCEGILHKYILDILHKYNIIIVSELMILLNNKTKHLNIQYNSKKKPLSTYINCIYGNFIKFLDDYSMYGIVVDSKDIYVKLIDRNLTYNKLTDKIIKENHEWLLINDEEFIIV